MFGQPTNRKEEQSEMAFKARQNNVLNILQGLTQNSQALVDKETMLAPDTSGPKKNQEKKGMKAGLEGIADFSAKAQNFIPLPQIEQEVEVMAFDEEGNFKAPPYNGYWRDMLKKINENDPYKTGRDWRDEAIEKFSAAEAALDEAEAALGIRR